MRPFKFFTLFFALFLLNFSFADSIRQLKISFVSVDSFQNEKQAFENCIESIKKEPSDFVILSGNSGDALTTKFWLNKIQYKLNYNIYFILGHRNFYFGMIEKVRQQVIDFSRQKERLFYLPANEFIHLSDEVALVGQDGLADYFEGSFKHLKTKLNRIKDFSKLNKKQAFELFEENGKKEANHLQRKLTQAFKQYKKVILVLETSPFKKSQEDKNQKILFLTKQIGQMLTKMMQDKPTKELVILCTDLYETHTFKPFDNILVQCFKKDNKVYVVEID